jgi:hypothetical protein
VSEIVLNEFADPKADYRIGECEDWDTLPYESKLNITEFIFKKITINPVCSFRRLIYCRLGFKPNAYSPLYMAGGMTIMNSINELENC